jgi:hypothetical protein
MTAHVGVNGEPILFYARLPVSRPVPRQRRPSPQRVAAEGTHARWGGIVEGLRALGLEGVTSSQVEAAVRESYPSGTEGIEQGNLLRACFRSLRSRRNTGDNVR